MPPDDAPLFETTRGKLLLLLAPGPRTVNELMAELALTDNAVRAHLGNLQSQGLVRQTGLRPGTRKPHAEFELTPDARLLFPRAHEPVLGALVDVLHDRLPPDQLKSVLTETARRLLTTWFGQLTPPVAATGLCEKLRSASPGLCVDRTADHLRLQAAGCPLASVTAAHPELCALLAEVLTELLGTTVQERCDRHDTPRCCFEVRTK